MKTSKIVRGALVWGILGLSIMSATARGSIVVMSTDVPKAIPDDSPVGVTSTLEFPSMTIEDVDLILTIIHPFVDDCHIELTSPAGTTARLIDSWNEGGILHGEGGRVDFVDTHLDDEAPVNLRDGIPPHTGHYNIVWPGNDTMSFFDGQNAGGTWTLFVADLAAADVGRIESWGLEVVPEPATIALLGLGALQLLRRRKST